MIRPLQNFTAALRRHPRLMLAALLLGVAAAGTSAIILWAQYHLDAAQRALERYAFDEAQHHLDLCLKVRSGSAAVHILAAQTARRRDAYDEAERHLADCIRLGGVTPATALERMLLTAQQGDLEGVEAPLRARTGADRPEAVLVLEALAKGYANRFWESNALVGLNILLERQPQHPQALLLRARAWENRVRKGEKEHEQDALRDYEKAVELLPSFEAQLGLAGTLYRVGRTWEAMLMYERLRPLQPANPALLLGLARCKYSLHEVDEAQRLLDELLEQYPNHTAGLLERGRLALHAGQLAEAEQWLRRAASASPRYDVEAHRVLYRCLEAARKTAEARQCLDELQDREAEILDVERLILRANREPRDVALRYETAIKQMRLGREQDAVAALFFILEQQPQHGPARATLVDYLERVGQPGRAARYRRAIFSSASTSSR
jgi:tetratricopeptide (TPR) repeat protein